MQIQGKKIILTGAASGIGRALLRLLSEQHTTILAADIDQNGLLSVLDEMKENPAEISHFSGDLSYQDTVDELFEQGLEKMGGIDLFIANAGYAYYEKISQPDWKHIEKIYQINVFSPIYSAIKMMDLNKGKIFKMVITGSAMGHLAIPGYAIYSSTKAALHRFAEAYRFELPEPSMLTLAYPIGTRTSFFDRAATKPAPTTWPTQSSERVAQAIIKGIEKDQPAIYPSSLFRFVMFADRFLPIVRRLEQQIEYRRFIRWMDHL